MTSGCSNILLLLQLLLVDTATGVMFKVYWYVADPTRAQPTWLGKVSRRLLLLRHSEACKRVWHPVARRCGEFTSVTVIWPHRRSRLSSAHRTGTSLSCDAPLVECAHHCSRCCGQLPLLWTLAAAVPGLGNHRCPPTATQPPLF